MDGIPRGSSFSSPLISRKSSGGNAKAKEKKLTRQEKALMKKKEAQRQEMLHRAQVTAGSAAKKTKTRRKSSSMRKGRGHKKLSRPKDNGGETEDRKTDLIGKSPLSSGSQSPGGPISELNEATDQTEDLLTENSSNMSPSQSDKALNKVESVATASSNANRSTTERMYKSSKDDMMDIIVKDGYAKVADAKDDSDANVFDVKDSDANDGDAQYSEKHYSDCNDVNDDTMKVVRDMKSVEARNKIECSKSELTTDDVSTSGEQNRQLLSSDPVGAHVIAIDTSSNTDYDENEESVIPYDYWTSSITLEDGSKLPAEVSTTKWEAVRTEGKRKLVNDNSHSGSGKVKAETASTQRKSNLGESDNVKSTRPSSSKGNNSRQQEKGQTFSVGRTIGSSLSSLDKKKSIRALRSIRKKSVVSRCGGTFSASKFSLQKPPSRPITRAPGPTSLESKHYRLGMESTQLPKCLSAKNVFPARGTEQDEAIVANQALQAAADLRVSIAWSVRKANDLQNSIIQQQQQLDGIVRLLDKQRHASELLSDFVKNQTNPLMAIELASIVKGLHDERRQLETVIGGDPTPPDLPPRK